jgi:uncharacterized membrane protein YgdD (TMEM256/DUF423 family)
MTQSAQQRFPLLAAGLLGLTGVALGALGGHALASMLAERGMTHAWETGARYHLFHAIALLAIAGMMREESARNTRLTWAARCWCVGVLLFSGSLYWTALGAPRFIWPATPAGGIALLAGWVFVIAAAVSRPPANHGDPQE